MVLSSFLALSLALFARLCNAAIYDRVEDLPDINRYDYVVVGGTLPNGLMSHRKFLNFAVGGVAGSVVGKANAQAASRKIIAMLNNQRLK